MTSKCEKIFDEYILDYCRHCKNWVPVDHIDQDGVTWHENGRECNSSIIRRLKQDVMEVLDD